MVSAQALNPPVQESVAVAAQALAADAIMVPAQACHVGNTVAGFVVYEACKTLHAKEALPSLAAWYKLN